MSDEMINIQPSTTLHDQEGEQEYYVVRNIEEQYSVWPTFKEIPNGWESVGEPRVKSKCLEYVKEVWTDMRPLSLRKEMEKAAGQ